MYQRERVRPWHPFRSPGLCGMRGTLTIMAIISIIITAPFIWWEIQEREQAKRTMSNDDTKIVGFAGEIENITVSLTNSTITQNQTDAPDTPRPSRYESPPTTTRDPHRWVPGLHNITCTQGRACIAIFDFCIMGHCKDVAQAVEITSADKYLCMVYDNTVSGRSCESWEQALWTTAEADWGYQGLDVCETQKSRLTLTRVMPPQHCRLYSCNPLRLVIKNVKECDSSVYSLGAYTAGADPVGSFFLKVVPEPAELSAPVKDIPAAITPDSAISYLNVTSIKQLITVETGYEDRNVWLDWMIYTAERMKINDCVACAPSRPVLGTVPFKLSPWEDPVGFKCALKLYSSPEPPVDPACIALHYEMPPLEIDTQYVPPYFTPYAANYTCFYRESEPSVGVGDLSWCKETHNVTVTTGGYEASWFNRHTTARADMWWYCGGKRLFPILPINWAGRCALIQLVMPFYALPVSAKDLLEPVREPSRIESRKKRAAAYTPPGSFNPSVYIDVLGVPRGVPDEFKARNQVAAGFESFLFWWATINKNVDWINYLFYNQIRFINYTRDAVEGLHGQLDKTSLMAWQNRMALDMLLAEKGGVCKMFGSSCCTFIPNNTAPDGTVTRALKGLTSLAEELSENSGFEDPFSKLLESWFGKWKTLALSMFTSLMIAVAILTVCGCCCIPCLRGLMIRLIETSLTKQNLMLMKHQSSARDYYQEIGPDGHFHDDDLFLTALFDQKVPSSDEEENTGLY